MRHSRRLIRGSCCRRSAWTVNAAVSARPLASGAQAVRRRARGPGRLRQAVDDQREPRGQQREAGHVQGPGLPGRGAGGSMRQASHMAARQTGALT